MTFETSLPIAWALVVASILGSCVAAVIVATTTDSFVPLMTPFVAAAAMTWFVRKFVVGTLGAKRVLIAFPWLIATGLAGTFALLALLLGGIPLLTGGITARRRDAMSRFIAP